MVAKKTTTKPTKKKTATKKKERCAWCARKLSNNCALGVKCDFSDLPYKKQDIIERLQFEAKNITESKNKIVRTRMSESEIRKEFESIMDRVSGMTIMVNALKRDFQMPEEEIKFLVRDHEKFTTIEKIKLLGVAHRLQEAREAKKGGKANGHKENR